MEYLHVAIIEDFEECLISRTQLGLREKVSAWLTAKSLPIPTDAEWAVCVLAEEDKLIEVKALTVGLISYYKADAQLDS